MTLKYDLRLATSVARPFAESLYTNITTDLGAMLKRREYPGIHETSFDPFDPVTAANPYPGYRTAGRPEGPIQPQTQHLHPQPL